MRRPAPQNRFAIRSRRFLALGWVLVALFATTKIQAQTAPAPATAAADAAPQPKPLLILRINGKALALKTLFVKQSLGSLLVETIDGTAQVLDPSALIKQLAWYTDAEMESGRVDLNALAIRYRAFAGLYPEVRAILSAEAQRFQEIAARNTAASSRRTADTQKRISDFLALRFDPTAAHSRDEVDAIVREGDELAGLAPAQAAQIAQAVSTAKDTLSKMDAGQVFYDGRWMPGAEEVSLRKSREEEIIQKSFSRTLSLPIGTLALSAGQTFAVVGLPMMILLTLLITGLVMLAGKRRGTGVLVTATALAITLLGYHLLTEENAGALTVPVPDAPDTIARSGRVVAMLYRASAPQPTSPSGDRDLTLTNADLSSFLARQVTAPTVANTGFGLRREALAIGVTRDGFTLLERTVFASRRISLRYDLKIDGGSGSPRLKSYTVRAGGLSLPEPIKSFLWSHLAPALGQYIEKHRLIESYALIDMGRGEIRLASARALGAPTAFTRPTTTSPDAASTPAPAMDTAPAPPESRPTPSVFGGTKGNDTAGNPPPETPASVPGAGPARRSATRVAATGHLTDLVGFPGLQRHGGNHALRPH